MSVKLPVSRKFGGKLYTLVHSHWVSLSDERSAKSNAEYMVKRLRASGCPTRLKREILTRYPAKGPEVFYNVYSRRDGMSLAEVRYRVMKILGTAPLGHPVVFKKKSGGK